MKKTTILILLCSMFGCSGNKKEIAYCYINYINLGTDFFEPISSSDFYYSRIKGDSTLIIKDEVEKSRLQAYDEKLKLGLKLNNAYNDIDPRVFVKIIYTDSSSNCIYIDHGGKYMLDTIGIVYKKNEEFIKYLEKIINNPKMEW